MGRQLFYVKLSTRGKNKDEWTTRWNSLILYMSHAGDPGLIPESERSTGEGIGYPLQYSWASLVALLVKNPPAMQDTWVRSLGWEEPLEKGKATTAVFWPEKIPCLWGHKESDSPEWLSLHLYVTCCSFSCSCYLPWHLKLWHSQKDEL